MLEHLVDRAPAGAIPIEPVPEGGLERWLARQGATAKAWVAANGYKAKPGRHLPIPDAAGKIAAVVLGVTAETDIWSYGDLPMALPDGVYKLPEAMKGEAATAAALGWALGGYGFDRYKKR